MSCKNLVFTLLLILCLFQELQSQTPTKPWAVGIELGKQAYNGDLGNGFFSFEQPLHLTGGLTVTKYVNSWLDVNLHGSYGNHGYFEWINGTGNNEFLGTLTQFNLTGRIKILDGPISPWIAAGLGYGIVGEENDPARVVPESALHIPLGLGAKIRIGEAAQVYWQSTFGLFQADGYDKSVENNNNDNFLHHAVGVSFNLGATIDTDKDGIADKNDKCPLVAGLYQFDGCPDTDNDGMPDKDDKCPLLAGPLSSEGCPDTDGDGIVDSKDRCPTAAGPVATNGCPDSDSDGVLDKDDRCPNLVGPAASFGCPDTDGDGVYDNLDKCPNEIGISSNDGCPQSDRDGDGVADNIDQCPDTPGVAGNRGCPRIADSDNDGVPDDKDRCPSVSGLISNDGCPAADPDSDGDGIVDRLDKCPFEAGVSSRAGCPELSVETRRIFEEALRGINFESSRATIRSNSYGILNEVVGVMLRNPNYNLEIIGHTDSQGDANTNQKLSENRAQAVKMFLVNKGIEAFRMTALGFGESVPIADNNTAEGRATNRRVAFKVKYN